MSLDQPAVGRERVRLAGGQPEPAVLAERLIAAIGGDPEPFRALLPVGYQAGVEAYRAAAGALRAEDLADHYTRGLSWFHGAFAPHLRRVLSELAGGEWDLEGFEAFAAGSDVDLMTHLVDGVACREEVALFPGDWHGFRVGAVHRQNIRWDAERGAALACLCVPSVRNGLLTEEMVGFLGRSRACLLNLNLFPTLIPEERARAARALSPLLPGAVLSISFSRGFGLTASQLGVFLVRRDHPLRERFLEQWQWFTYFHNALAAQAFLEIDLAELARVDAARREWVDSWLRARDLPAEGRGSYYVRSFRVEAVPEALRPLVRDDIVRLCFKPPLS